MGIKGNEEADRLAKEALRNPSVDTAVIREAAEWYGEVEKLVLQRWQEAWNKSATGAHSRLIAPTVSLSNKYCVSNSRVKEVMISRLRLGKCRLNWYLYNQKLHSNGLCNTCQVPETIEHYLLQCKESKIYEVLECECNKLTIPSSRPCIPLS